jgi:Zn finger protein HypA/HybF involved in hydrogenase expression
MHEVGLVSAAIDLAIETASQAGAHHVERLTFALRPGGHVSREAVRMLVEALGRGTPVEGAAVEFEHMPDGLDRAELALRSVDVTVDHAIID